MNSPPTILVNWSVSSVFQWKRMVASASRARYLAVVRVISVQGYCATACGAELRVDIVVVEIQALNTQSCRGGYFRYSVAVGGYLSLGARFACRFHQAED